MDLEALTLKLHEMDTYFLGVVPETMDKAAYNLSTYIFDKIGFADAGPKKKVLQKIIKTLPEELWVEAFKKWADEDHDT